MFYKKRILGFIYGIILMSIMLGAGDFTGDSCQAAAKRDGYLSLKRILESPGEAEIELNDDIFVRSTICVRGRKRIIGNGYSIRRADIAGKKFGGTIFSVTGGMFALQDTVVSGSGKKSGSKKIYGRLVEVKKGTFVLGKKAVLKDNCNISRGEEGGGAVIIRRYGNFIMKAGEISGNRTVTEGAAVFIEKGGRFEMKGGVIQKNTARGIGAIEGFDGRGGAIYNNGTAVIKNGLIRKNYALSFYDGKMIYGGVGGMLFNRGSCVITGGTIEKNVSSYGGGAIYSDRNSTLRILGGKFKNNQADRGRTIFFCGQSCYLNVNLDGKEIYQENGANIRKGKQIKTSKPEGTKKKRQTGGSSPLVWNTKRIKRIYYSGENLNDNILRYGIRAEYQGKEISEKIYVVRVSGVLGENFGFKKTFRADRTGKGRLYFAIRDDSVKGMEYSVPYVVKKNHLPCIRTAPRYLFTWEVGGYSQKRWKDVLWEGIRLEDQEDETADLWKRADIKMGKVSDGKAGFYKIQVGISDQWGHRFYMKGKKKRQYGKGKQVWAKITVTLVQDNDSEETVYGTVRFQPAYILTDTVQQEWHFTPELLREIRCFLETCTDPFSETTNEAFLKRFGKAERKSESGG